MRTLIVVIAVMALLLVACGGPSGPAQSPQEEPQQEPQVDETSTEVNPPLPDPTQAQVKPTDTPLPPPPTPTPAPTNTPAPEAEEETSSAPAITDVMVEIPGGPFTLGNDNSDPNEAPAQEMDLPAFTIDGFEVTNADFDAFVEATGYATYREQEGSAQTWRWAYGEGEDNHPVVMVTFDDAQAFCEWAGKRLPTEFEWERAARGPEGSLYPWGNEYDATQFNGKDGGLRGTTAVGSFPANGHGLFDVAGNVKEWVDSSYVAYPGSNYQDGKYSPDYRGIRGGGWFDTDQFVLSTNRNGGDPATTANDDIGFRCAR